MEDKYQAWFSLLEDSSPWNNTSTQPTSFFSDQAASTLISSAIPQRTIPRLSSALVNSYGQILSPIHPASITATTPYISPSKISGSLTQYSISTSDLTVNASHKSCDSVPQSNQKWANASRANEKPRLPIFSELLNQNTSKTSRQQKEPHSQQTQKDVHSTTEQSRERSCESKRKANTAGSLVFPFPTNQNLHLPNSKQKRTFESGLVKPLTPHWKDTPEVLSGLNVAPDIRKSFPDLFNPSLAIRAEPAGRDIPQSVNRPTSAPTSTDNKENKGPVPKKGHDNVVLVNPNTDNMNSVIIESASKEQVRYQKTPLRNLGHEELGASSVSSEEEMDTDISSKATGYASTLSTLLDYMSVDERVKLLPPSTLKTNTVPDLGGLSNDRDAGGGSPASIDSGTSLLLKGLSNPTKNESLFTEARSDLQPLANNPTNRHVPEMDDFMMPPVGNRDNFIPVGSESNIQTMGINARSFRGVAVGGGGSGSPTPSLGTQLDANIHITISRTSCPLDIDLDTLLPMEERERFLPTGADSESLDKATSSSGSNNSDTEDNVQGCYQVNNILPNQVLTGSINEPMESVSYPAHELRELGLTRLVDTNLEGATASCQTDSNPVQRSTEDYMDVVERQKFIKTDLRVSFDACNDLPKNRESSASQEPSFNGHFNQVVDNTNLAKSEPDLLLGHSLNFGICDPDLHQSIASGENHHPTGSDGLSDRRPNLDSDALSEVASSRNPQDFTNPTQPILLPVQSLSLGDFTCPVEGEEDDTDELIKMASSVLMEPPIGNSCDKTDPTPAKQAEFKSPAGNSDLSSTPTDNPHLSQTNLNDNVSTTTSNQLTESGRGTLGSSDVSSSPLNMGDNSKLGEDPNLNNQDASSKNHPSSSDLNAVTSKAENVFENANEVQGLNAIISSESSQSSDKNSEVHGQADDNSLRSTSVHLADSENSSLSTDLYLPLSTVVVKGSVNNTTASEPNSARSYENDQSQDSDILGKQVNSLLCRTAYLEYRNQNAHTSKKENHEISQVAPRSASYLMPSPEAYKFDTSSLPAKSGYTEEEGLNYDQLEQDLTDLQNGLAQGMQLKNPILQDKEQGILNRSNHGIGHSANSPDVLQDSKLPTNLFRRTTQQADLLLGMDRILRKKEQAFDTHTASMNLPLLAGPLRNETLQMTCHEDGTSLKTVSRYPLLADSEMVSLAQNLTTENKPKQDSEETVFVLPNQVSDHEGASSGVSLGNTPSLQHTPEVIDDLALRVERILSEEPLYDMHKTNFLDKIRPKEGFFGKLSFDSSDQNSIKSEIIPETCLSRVELPKSTNSVCKFPSNQTKNQEFEEQGPHFGNVEILEDNTERICLGGSVASKESSENYQVSTISDYSHSMGSLNKESSHEVPDSSVVQSTRNDLPTEGEASCPKTGNLDNSNYALIVDQNEEEPISQHSRNKDEALTEPVNFEHNETFPNTVNESANSTKFLEDDVRRCLDWSNMSTFSSPLIPVTQADNFQALSELVEHISHTESENKPVPTATILDVPRNDLKRTSVFSESSITSSYVSSFSRSGSISGKSATSSSHAESECHSSNTVASVCAVSAEKKTHESSNFDNNLPKQSNSHQRCDARSSSSSLLQNSSPRNVNKKSSANNANQRIDPSFCSEGIRRSDNNVTMHSSQKLDDDFYSSSESNDGLPKSPYKLSLSESQPNFHPKNQIQMRNANKSCSDISALRSEDPAPFLKSKDFTDSESLRRDLEALSNCGQLEEGVKTPSSLERKTPKEGGDIASQPTSKSFPSVSPSIVVSPLEPDSVGAVSEQGDCLGLIRGHSNDSNSVVSQFYESANSRGFVIGKTSSSSSSSISSTNQSRNNSAQVQTLVSALKGKRHKKSGQMKSAEKLQTNVEFKGNLDPHLDTARPISKGQSDGMEVNSPQSTSYQPNPIPPTETRVTSSSSGSNSSSPLGSVESAASHKTWTLRPYKPPGSREWYYTGYSSECLATGESGTTTLESADTGSDDAIGPQIPKEFLGTRVDVPSRPGIYSRAINKKKIPVQEDNLYLSTILEKSFLDDRNRANRISEKRNSQCLHINGYSAKGVDHGIVPASGTKSLPTEFKSRNKDLGEAFCTPQRIEHLVSKENNSARSLNQNKSLRPLDFENSETKALYDSCRLEVDNAETCREEQNYPEKVVANQSVLDLPAKNQSSFESATTTVDTPSGFTTDPDYMTSGLRQFEPSFSSADSGQLQNISGVAGQCHPMVRYGPMGLLNSPRATTKDVSVVNDQSKSKTPTVCTKTPEILPQRTERVVRSSKELDYLWSKFKQQDHSDRDSSLDSERLEHMHQLLKNPTHAHVHQSLEKIENSRLKQAKVAAHKMEEQKRALLRSKIQDESSSVLESIYSNRDSSCNGTAQRDGGSLSSRPSSSSDTLSSIAAERRVAQHREVQSQGVPRGSEAGVVDPIMARLRQKIDKQRKKCEQMKVRDKVSEQKLRKLTHILVNRQMNDLILAAEMSSLSTTSTASVTTASETVPKTLLPNASKNQPEIPRRRTNPVSRQQSDKSHQKDNHPPSGSAPNSKGQGKFKGQSLHSRSKQINPRGFQNQRHRGADSPEIPISEQHSDTDHSNLMQRGRPRKKDVATMAPSPRVVSTETTSDSEESCYIVKSSIGIQTSPPQEVHENGRRPNFFGPKYRLENQSSKVNSIQNAGSTISPHKSSVEEVQVIPVPFMSTPKRYKNLANKALYKTSDNHWKKTSVDKANEAWFISLSDRSATSTQSPRQHQHHQSMGSFASNPKAVGRESNKKKMNVRNQSGVNKKTAINSHGPISHAAAPVHLVNGSLGLSKNTLQTLAITNQNADDVENKITLQEAFFNRMQSWISRSRERQKRISLAAEERRYQQQMELEREEMFLNRKPTGNNIVIHPFSDNLYKPKKRVLTKKEIRDLNERLYKKLPEVVEQEVLLHRAKEYRTNRIRSRIFSMHVQKSLLTKATCR